jgi:hypothetical protein
VDEKVAVEIKAALDTGVLKNHHNDTSRAWQEVLLEQPMHTRKPRKHVNRRKLSTLSMKNLCHLRTFKKKILQELKNLRPPNPT